jgi:hypothetical protein
MTKSRDLVREPRLNNSSPETDRQTDRLYAQAWTQAFETLKKTGTATTKI